jgi:hypothetical protein
MLLAALGLWWWALADTNLGATGAVGLINAFPTAFYLAVALVVIAVVLALLWAPFSRLACTAGLVTFVFVIYGTPALLYSEPQYAWVYKHLGVIRYLELHGSTDRSIDIYQNWPGFFAANAWLARATGMDPGAYAAWAPVFFDLCLLAAVLYALGGIITNPRRRYGVAFMWLLGSWIGQDYLAPQAMSIVLVVVVLGMVLRIGAAGGWDREPKTRLGRSADGWRSRAAEWAHRLVRSPAAARQVHDPPRPVPALGRRDRTVGIVLILLLSAAIITSHQLSPGTLLLDLVVLVAFTGWRRLWLVIVAIGIGEIAWLLLAWPSVSKFGLFNVVGPVSPQVSRGTPLAALAVVQDASRAMGIAFWLLGLAGVVRMLRRVGGDPASPAAVGAFALSPYLIVPLQSYGGEASLRAYLFSLPWLALLALEGIWPSGRLAGTAPNKVRPRESSAARTGPARRRGEVDTPGQWGLRGARHRPWLLFVVAPLLAVGLMISYYGYALTNQMTTSDVAAATWVEQNVPSSAIVYSFSPSFPNKLTARYPAITYYSLTLTDDRHTLADLAVPARRADSVRNALSATGARTIYLVVTPSMHNYDRLNGVIPEPDITAVVKDLRAAPDFTIVYDRGGSTVFRYSPPAP